MSKVKRVVCLVSGSIDSAVAALLSKRKGYEVTGLFLKNKYQDDSLQNERLERAERVCKKLDVPLKELTLHNIQWDNYMQALLASYRKNLVPDWNVVFNQQVMFNLVVEHAVERLDANAIATGHYARTSLEDNIFTTDMEYEGNRLLKAIDLDWDESFLLSQIKQRYLRQTLFPLGDFKRDIVFKVAESTQLSSLCKDRAFFNQNRGVYVDEKKVLDAIRKMLPYENKKGGSFTMFRSGLALGPHQGLHGYRVGQKVELDNRTFYITEKNQKTGNIALSENKDHPALFCDSMFISLAHWNHDTPYDFFEKQMIESEFCYGDRRQPVVKCVLTVGMNNEYCGNDHLILSSTKPVRAVNPGSHTALYHGEECTGGATVLRSGASQYALNYHKFNKQDKRVSNPLFNFFRKF